MRRIFVLTSLAAGCFALIVSPVRAEGLQKSTEKFVYKDATGRVTSVKVHSSLLEEDDRSPVWQS